ncbi:hypothetical protein IC229_02700 [Spirosoma sp. BT702]|uniref:Uncharacterized protein n=1 Tax=Spirosoma profusum TaxID=2771354 RepID=A0A926XSY5_9BACT|nr:putative Ig domain-containing protein [Spirosoma profusum]MBD2699529.1 hypothetical protein [Spirosoma profusum]
MSTLSATTSLTVNAPASATIAYAGSPFLTSSVPVDVNLSGTTGGSYTASPSGLSLDASTGQITPANSNPGTYTVAYTVAASGGCPPLYHQHDPGHAGPSTPQLDSHPWQQLSG